MWEFNEVDRDNNYLAHASGHKYIERKWKNGRWAYRYADDRFQRGSSPARVRNRYSAQTAARRNSTVEERLRNAKWNIAKLSMNNALDDDFKMFKDRKKFRNTAGVTHETARALNDHYKNVTKYLPTNTSRASNVLAREERNIVDKGLAEIASRKSKKSLKRKAKKAYYKTRDAVRSIPSPVNTHKVYKTGNRMTVVDERGPLISTKSNRKSRKRKEANIY